MVNIGYSKSVSFSGIINSLALFPLVGYIIGFVHDFIITVMKTGPLPKHVALIMDGNRRYAKANNLPLKDGHNAGAQGLIHVLDTCYRLGVHHITIYAFSIENFNRSKSEVDTLFGLLREKLMLLSEHEESYARFNKVRVRVIGNKSLIPEDILKDLESIEEKTKDILSTRTLNVCFPYTSHDEITHSIKTIVDKYDSKQIESKDKINLKTLNDNMYLDSDTPPLDILVRTSGHTRLSDFMLWQCNHNCTIEFVETLWPDFKFMGIISVLLKWSYYKTLQLEELSLMGIKSGQEKQKINNILNELPPPPPFASVVNR